jgi:hypothetical protein
MKMNDELERILKAAVMAQEKFCLTMLLFYIAQRSYILFEISITIHHAGPVY